MDLEILNHITAVVSDVDGVMTDGTIIVSPEGETKHFSVRDGMAIKLLQKAGIEFALLSGRESKPLRQRADELGIRVIKTGRIDKQTALEEIVTELGIPVQQMAYIGDDLPDLAPIQMVAAGFCPQDAVPEVCAAAHVVPVNGGRGVVRHVAEIILKQRGLWEGMVRHFEVKP